MDGAVAGTWRYEKGKVRTEPFGRLDAAARRELDAEAERLAALPRLSGAQRSEISWLVYGT